MDIDTNKTEFTKFVFSPDLTPIWNNGDKLPDVISYNEVVVDNKKLHFIIMEQLTNFQ